MTRSRKVAATFLCVLALSPALAADELPAPSLRLSRQLTLPPRGQPVDKTERALLRVEWKAAQSGVDEAAAVDDMLLKLRRMGRSVTQLRRQMTGTVSPLPRRESMDPVPVEPPSGPASDYWLPAIATITALALLFVVWRRRRHKPLMKGTTFEPLDATLTAVLPGTPIRGAAETLAPPTIDSGQAFNDDRPPITIGRLTPPGDDQIPLDLADVLVSMDLVDGAVKTLEEYIRQHPRRALCHWLRLLEVYRRSGMEKEFEAAAGELNQQFNVAAIDWQPPETAVPALALDSYPHIRARLQTVWRRRGCADYLTQLLEDNRGGTRIGFPQSVVEEILFLQEILRD
jgi:hypothetical protein